MKTMKMQKVLATEILDSRGTPTVGATVILSDGSVGTAKMCIRDSACAVKNRGRWPSGKETIKMPITLTRKDGPCLLYTSRCV